MINFIRKKIKSQNILELEIKNEVPFLFFPDLDKTNIVKHGFSTRLGGVSKGIFESMNLSFSRGDDKDSVYENFMRILNALEMKLENLVLSDQTHTTNIKVVTEEDKGKGILRDRDYSEIDGFVTNVPEIVLSTFYADCVPLFFVDPVRKAIGLSHAGWKGTLNRIAEKTIKVMSKEYGTDPKDVLVGIGPSICQDCYEISEDLAGQFISKFSIDIHNEILFKKDNLKYCLDLWKTNFFILRDVGVLPENIFITDICTNCNPNFLFSHRASNGKRGNLGAFLMLK